MLGKTKLFCHSIHSSNYLEANPSFGAFNSFVILLVLLQILPLDFTRWGLKLVHEVGISLHTLVVAV